MHTSYDSYSKSLSDDELVRELAYAKERLSEQHPMRQALAAEAARRVGRPA